MDELAFTCDTDFRKLGGGTISVTGATGASGNMYTYDVTYQGVIAA